MSEFVKVEHRVTLGFINDDGDTVMVEITRTSDGLLFMWPDGSRHSLPSEVVEALYDVWLEVPVGSGNR